MAPALALKPSLSVEDYLAGEQDGEIRHEYGAGDVYAMAESSDQHGLLAGALSAQMYPHSRHKRCQLFMADMKVRLEDKKDSYFYYPDLLLSCDPEDRESAYYRRKPCLLVKSYRRVLFASTGVKSYLPTAPCRACVSMCWCIRTSSRSRYSAIQRVRTTSTPQARSGWNAWIWS